MSEFAARAALERMNLNAVLIAPHCDPMTLAADLWRMSKLSAEEGQKKFLESRAEICQAYGFTAKEQRKPFAFADGIAIIPVHGTLVNRFGGSYGYITGYNFLRSQVSAAMADDDVKGIVYDVNSYGGEAAGCFECVAEMREMTAGKKPTMAIVDSNCYSAAYAIATAADKITVTPSGGAGSIGVVAMHVDVSEALNNFGVKITFIHAGKHKVDGNPFEKLSDEVRADIQKGVDQSYARFVGVVAANRKMDEKRVRATEARIYRAEDAQGLGLIDAVASPSQAVQAFLGGLSGSTNQPEQEPDMAEATKPGADQASTQDAAAVRAAEKARVAGIMNCEEAKGREALAKHLAFETDMSAEAAKGILSASPKAEAAPAQAANPFKQAMDGDKHPNVGADTGAAASGEQGAVSKADEILGAQAAASGLKLVSNKG